MPSIIYDIDERATGYAVKGRLNEIATRIDLTEKQADRLAHHLVGREGYVVWRDIRGRFERCPCKDCKRH
jgi:hypothetical protein